jgi:uncharacterized protein
MINEKQLKSVVEPFGLPFRSLPKNIPIFPLSGALLLPHGRMPLNIFEDRYVKMVMDSIRESRLIGMVQPNEEIRDASTNEATLFHIGCLGRIISFSEMDDGRIFITLQGVARFKIKNELENQFPYRSIRAQYEDFKDDYDPYKAVKGRNLLTNVLENYLEEKKVALEWEELAKTKDRRLIASIGMMLPFGNTEKQAILESVNFDQMVDIINSLIEMELATGESVATKH